MAEKNRRENTDSIVSSLLRIGVFLQREGGRIVGEYGLKQQQFVVLNEIVRKKEIIQKELVGELLFEKSNVSKIVKKLRNSALIEVFPSPEDGRMTVLRATENGNEVWSKGMKSFSKWNKEWLRSLSKRELGTAVNVLEQLNSLAKGD